VSSRVKMSTHTHQIQWQGQWRKTETDTPSPEKENGSYKVTGLYPCEIQLSMWSLIRS
jgi:hypothetical protein